MASDPQYAYVAGSSTHGLSYISKQQKAVMLSMAPNYEDPDDWIAFKAPETCTKLYSSSKGLMLGEPYCIFNPLDWWIKNERIIDPPQTHPLDIPRALVVSGNPGFHVICAVPRTDPQYQAGTVFSFDVYSSTDKEWRQLPRAHVLGKLRADTNVSCGSKACWLTEAHTVAYYDTVDGAVGLIPIPEIQYSMTEYNHVDLQLGTRDEELCIVAVAGTDVKVYKLEASGQWSCSYRFRLLIAKGENGKLPHVIPIRFQSKKFQVPFWTEGHFLIWEEEWDASATDDYDWVKYVATEEPMAPTEVLPLIKSSLDPVESV